MRTDPTDTGGLFVGRRPGTRKVHYRDVPERAAGVRGAVDQAFAHLLAAVMALGCLAYWGPIPVAWLWVGSQVDHQADSVILGILATFAGLLATLFGGLVLLKRVDGFWILVRRAAGVDQRDGILPRIFAYTALAGASIFGVWLLFFSGARLAPAL